MFKTLVSNRFHHESLLRLKNSQLTDVHTANSITQLKEHLATASALLIRSGTSVDAALLSQCPQLQVVISATSGFDHIDYKSCTEKGVIVMHTPQANTISAAEHTLGLMLASARRYGVARDNIKMGNWDREPLMGFELYGKTLGLIGYGRIGQRVAHLARAFGMSILIHDPYVEQSLHPDEVFLGFEEVCRRSDVVSFHVPLTRETYHMMRESTLDWLSPHTLLINASRGTVFCSHTLQNHVVKYKNFLVGLDVFESEPLSSDSVLIRHPNIFSTPHVGATTTEAIARASDEAVDKLLLYIQNKTATDTVPPQAPWAEKLF